MNSISLIWIQRRLFRNCIILSVNTIPENDQNNSFKLFFIQLGERTFLVTRGRKKFVKIRKGEIKTACYCQSGENFKNCCQGKPPVNGNSDIRWKSVQKDVIYFKSTEFQMKNYDFTVWQNNVILMHWYETNRNFHANKN